jgi:hypothetical protein
VIAACDGGGPCAPGPFPAGGAAIDVAPARITGDLVYDGGELPARSCGTSDSGLWLRAGSRDECIGDHDPADPYAYAVRVLGRCVAVE